MSAKLISPLYAMLSLISSDELCAVSGGLMLIAEKVIGQHHMQHWIGDQALTVDRAVRVGWHGLVSASGQDGRCAVLHGHPLDDQDSHDACMIWGPAASNCWATSDGNRSSVMITWTA